MNNIFEDEEIKKCFFKKNDSLTIDYSLLRIGYGCEENIRYDFYWESDMFCFLLRDDGKCKDFNDVLFYNRLANENKSAHIVGDCISGCPGCTAEGEIDLCFDSIPEHVDKIICFISLSRRDGKKITFNEFNQEFIYFRHLNNRTGCDGVVNGGMINWEGDKNNSVGKLCELSRGERGWIVTVFGETIDENIIEVVAHYYDGKID